MEKNDCKKEAFQNLLLQVSKTLFCIPYLTKCKCIKTDGKGFVHWIMNSSNSVVD